MSRAIAIIGVSGRYPQSEDVDALWENLRAARHCISEVPRARWDWRAFAGSPGDAGAIYSRWGGFIAGFDQFDAAFFGISPREADAMDPQERLFLEVAWAALEDAGYDVTASHFDRGCGVFVGVMNGGYSWVAGDAWSAGNQSHARSAYWSVANRVSYHCDLWGPSLAVDTACSSSLTALHLACESLRRGECGMAIAGGVNVIVHPLHYYGLARMRMLSSGDKCRAFGSGADGFVGGEGVGALVLKRLDHALRDGDDIRAVILGTAVNAGGKTNGYTVPNPRAQQQVVAAALADAGVDARTISYLEAHGTGTSLGDPVEVTALSRAYGAHTAARQFCALGSLKSNIGHLEAAAGVAAVTKVLLQLGAGLLAPTLHADEPNPHIDFGASPFFVQRELGPWQRPEISDGDPTKVVPRRAGVSSFGAGGANAHVILQEYVPVASASDDAPQALLLSARTVEALAAYARRLADFLDSDGGQGAPSFADVAYTSQVGRRAMPERLAVVASDGGRASAALRAFAVEQRLVEGVFRGRAAGTSRADATSAEALEEQARLWVSGAAVDWTSQHAERPRRRARMPTYPFERRRYWLGEHGPERGAAEHGAQPSAEAPAVEKKGANHVPKVRLSRAPSAPTSRDASPATIGAAEARDASPQQPPPRPEPSEPAPALGAPRALSPEAIQRRVREVLAAVLYCKPDELDDDKNFIELGLDSILLVEFVKGLNQTFGIRLKVGKLYDHHSIAALAAYLSAAGVATQPEPEPAAAPIADEAASSQALDGRPASAPESVSAVQPLEVPLPPIEAPVVPRASAREAIAIIGAAARFPGADNLSQFWDNLAQGLDSVTEVPRERWDVAQHFDADPKKKNKTYSKWGGFLSDIDKFDPLFFNISPAEAAVMDPQQRIFVEQAWRAFEDAGHSPDQLGGRRCGVFVGVMSNDYSGVVGRAPAARNSSLQMLGNAPSILAARIAYLLNLKGPAVAVDTACSSSLVATHLAIQSLLAGEVDLALAGGVTLYITEDGYIQMCQAGMLSPAGRCKAFDQRADGFVPGEGAAAIVLKRLSDALRDGDSIRGIIRGSGINQDGKTNGISAPSSESQTSLELEVYERSGVSPASISYVEAHGTGTKLGDPIEVEALTEAFARYTDAKQFCALGSVKTNLGHTSAAAGLAGLIKVLLSFDKRQIPPSLQFVAPNENIDFAATPFYVNTSLRDWAAPAGGVRRAAVSAFSFSGTNAHVVLEEPPARARPPAPATDELVPFSARTPAALRQLLGDTLAWLQRSGDSARLGDIAYTLQVGRAHHKVRTAFVVGGVSELVRALEASLAGRPLDCQLQSELDAPSKPDRVLGDLAQRLVAELGGPRADARERLLSLAALYVRQCPIAWAGRPRAGALRVPLPTYPFARDRHWVNQQGTSASGLAAQLDLPATRARLGGVCRTVLTAALPLVAEHRVNGAPVLPAMAALELACLAHAELLGREPAALSQVAWLEPCVVGADEQVLHAVIGTDGEHARFEIRAGAASSAPSYCKGRLLSQRADGSRPEALAIEAVRGRCPRHLEAGAIQQRLAAVGIEYGPSFQGLAEVWSNAEEALGRIEVAAGPAGAGPMPQVLDAAARAIVALVGDAATPWVPFALEALELHRPLAAAGYSHVRALGNGSFDVTVTDTEGEVCASLRGLRCRPLERSDARQPAAAALADLPSFYFVPRWVEQPQVQGSSLRCSNGAERVIVVSSADAAELADALVDVHPGALRVTLGEQTAPRAPGGWEWASHEVAGVAAWWGQSAASPRVYFICARGSAAVAGDLRVLDAEHERGLMPLFRLVKALGLLGWAKRPLELALVTLDAQAVLPGETPRPSGASLHGFGKSLAKEYPLWSVRCVDVASRDLETDRSHLLAQLTSERRAEGASVALRGARRYVLQLERARLEARALPLRDGGVYVIIGGAGGIGLELAEDLVRSVRARVVLVGRSEPTAEQRQRMEALEALGGAVLHIRADVADAEAMRAAVERARQRFGAIHGAVHSALVLRDALLERMDESAFVAPLRAKVWGSVVLAQALRREPLDFLLFFSSVQSFAGNPGQSNYAAASTFQDAYATALATAALAQNGPVVRVINWGYWGSVGAVTDPKYRRAMALRGVHSIEVAEGMRAIRHVLAGDAPQVVVFKGEPEVLAKLGVDAAPSEPSPRPAALAPSEPPARPGPSPSRRPARQPQLAEIERRIIGHTSRALAVEAAAIDPEVPFSDFGVDSITGAGMVEKISADFELELPITVVFDHANVRELARHVMERLESAAPAPLLGEEEAAPPPERPASPPLAPPASSPLAVPAPAPSLPLRAAPAPGAAPDDIAIIGMSGRFPGSADLDAFWAHLAAGDDLVGEIPPTRWDAAALYDPDPRNFEKTHCRWGGVLEGADEFDAAFFNISGKEAALIDPQQRLFLEESWKALEDAGYATRAVSNRRCGVFVGVGAGDYHARIEQAGIRREPHAIFGNDTSILAARISYFLNLKGPSLAINTACSSSLVAVHLACQSLRSGECELAIAGGVHVATTPNFFIYASNSGMLSGEGKCKAFAKSADGFVPGEGVGAVVLKPLAAALRDGDAIHGIIRASGSNQDGRTNGLTAPSASAQAELEAAVYAAAGVNPRSIGYVEAHGSATRLGDPIEVRALTDAFRRWTSDTGYCALGSVKTNIGHAVAAAGIAGLLKVLLALDRKALPPSLHFDEPNEHIDFDGSPFFVNTALRAWEPAAGAPRRAAISSFGFSGTNAHVLVDEAPAPERPRPDAFERHEHVLPLSARTPHALREQALRLAAFVAGDRAQRKGVRLGDVAFTLQTAREAMPERLAIVASDLAELGEALEDFAAGRRRPGRLFASHLGAEVAGHAAAASGAHPLAAVLLRGRAGEAFLQTVLAEGELDTLAELWVIGIELDWGALHRGASWRKISLPSYPFARTSHWVGAQPAALAEKPRAESSLKAAAPELLAGAAAACPPPFEREPYERLVDAVLLGVFQRLGAFRRGGEAHTLTALRERLRIAPEHARLFAELVRALGRAGYVHVEADEVRALPALEAVDTRPDALERERERVVARLPLAGPPLNVLWLCSARYGEVLRGELRATDVLFPGSSLDALGAIYGGNPVSDHFNQLVAAGVCRYARGRAQGQPGAARLRVLEVGAGTGATTRVVLDALREQNTSVDYRFTDVARSFIQHGQQRLSGAGLEFALLDIERDPAAQGFEPGSFDVVIAANVLHATASLRDTLGNVRALLRPGGWLLLNEVTAVQTFATAVLGLLPGWWRHRDGDLRLPGSPLLDEAGWERLLGEQGFSALVLGQRVQGTHALGQAVIVAERDATIVAAPRPRRPAPEATPPSPVASRLASSSPPPRNGRNGHQRGPIEAAIAASIEAVLKNGNLDLDPQKPFQEFGVDSIFAVEISERINQALGCELRSVDLFNYPTIAELAANIQGQLGPAAPALPAREPMNAGPAREPSPPAPRAAPPTPIPDLPTLALLERIEAQELDVAAVHRFVGGE